MTPFRLVAAAIAALSLCGAVAPQAAANDLGARTNAPFLPTPHSTVETMLRMAGVGPGDIHYDLGSGDGRISIAAVRDFGAARSTGIDLDPARVKEGIENAEKAGFSDRVRFVEGDVFEADFSDATVVTMYLLQDLNLELRSRLLALRPGTRLVSYQFHLGDWQADAAVNPSRRAAPGGNVIEDDESLQVYLWTVPAPVAGRWEWEAEGEVFRLDLHQEFQNVSGTLHAFGRETPIGNARLRGTALHIEARVVRDGRTVPLRIEGTVSGDAIEGAVEIDGARAALTARKL
ncbi:MAG: methyltransferase domain-containing protein [Alphaproteobacteria bacterium]|nr:methyltransferase domain-containing protein [Alphaproteobacteria bacterium]